MRLPALLAVALLLAGCTQNDPGSGGDDGADDFSSCPSWVKLPHNGQVIEGALLLDNMTTQPDFQRWDFMEWNATRPGQGLGDGHLQQFDGHPLDQIVLNFHQRAKQGSDPARELAVLDANLIVRFFASDGGYQGEPLEAWDQALGAGSAKHEWVFGPEPGKTYGIHNVTLRLDLAQPDEDPAPRGVFVEWMMEPDLDHNIDTPSYASMKYAPEFWYRTCSKNGERV